MGLACLTNMNCEILGFNGISAEGTSPYKAGPMKIFDKTYHFPRLLCMLVLPINIVLRICEKWQPIHATIVLHLPEHGLISSSPAEDIVHVLPDYQLTELSQGEKWSP